MGAKLDPDDAWTRLHLVAGLAKDGLTTEAEAELARLGTNYTALGLLSHLRVLEHRARDGSWRLGAFQHALSLSPSNFMVHLALCKAYNALDNNTKSREHAEMRLDWTRGTLWTSSQIEAVSSSR